LKNKEFQAFPKKVVLVAFDHLATATAVADGIVT
jgi:hypothetical protein